MTHTRAHTHTHTTVSHTCADWVRYVCVYVRVCSHLQDYLARMAHPAAWGGEPEMVMAVSGHGTLD